MSLAWKKQAFFLTCSRQLSITTKGKLSYWLRFC
jgi:hypothetical protein